MTDLYQCPQCGAELRKQIYLIVSAPLRQRSFTKTEIRKKEIQVLGKSQRQLGSFAYCGECGYHRKIGEVKDETHAS